LEDVIDLTRQNEISEEFPSRGNNFIRGVKGMRLAMTLKKGIRRATIARYDNAITQNLSHKWLWEGHGFSRAAQSQ
jgi:hypothetical protein